MTPLLEVEGLEVVYGRSIRAVQGVSLTVEEGQIVGLVGVNGAPQNNDHSRHFRLPAHGKCADHGWTGSLCRHINPRPAALSGRNARIAVVPGARRFSIR
jgi:branched-chain amino acid transport system ATP-binding protein